MADTATLPAEKEEQGTPAAQVEATAESQAEPTSETSLPVPTAPESVAEPAVSSAESAPAASTASNTSFPRPTKPTEGPSKTIRSSAPRSGRSAGNSGDKYGNAQGNGGTGNGGGGEGRFSRSSHSGGFSTGAPRRAAATTNLQPISGLIDATPDGHAVVRRGWGVTSDDAYLSLAVVRKLGLRSGDWVEGQAREPRENDRYWGMHDITVVNGVELSQMGRRRRFEDMVPVYPDSKLVLETGPDPLSTRLIDLIAPIGRGQRGLIVSPPKAGKTTIMKDIATGIAANYPDVHLMAVLIGERPEEVTDIRRHLEKITNGKGEVPASNFDEHASEQTRVSEVALERAKRLVEMGKDVVILLDSITRLARAYNLAMPTSGRTLSGGFDPAALWPPKRFFGAARNFEEGGSLTIIGTALVDTGSRMDDLIYEEFKGTGNQELHLDRRSAERRIYPAINIQKSGTRRDDLLFDSQDYQSIITLQRMVDMLGEDERTAVVLQRLKSTPNNKQFLASLKNG